MVSNNRYVPQLEIVDGMDCIKRWLYFLYRYFVAQCIEGACLSESRLLTSE